MKLHRKKVRQANGPTFSVKASCYLCLHCVVSESRPEQGDPRHRYRVSCALNSRLIGDTSWDTPIWCPVKGPPWAENWLTESSDATVDQVCFERDAARAELAAMTERAERAEKERDDARAALAVETGNANALAHECDDLSDELSVWKARYRDGSL